MEKKLSQCNNFFLSIIYIFLADFFYNLSFIQKKCSIIEQSVMSFRKKFCHKVFGGFIVSLWQKLMQKLSLVC